MKVENEEPESDPTRLDNTLLLAYVDGKLSADDHAQVQAIIRKSPEAAQRAALLDASRLPYREAFERQAMPPMPESLTKQVDALLQRYAVKPATASAETASPSPAETTQRFVYPAYYDEAARGKTAGLQPSAEPRVSRPAPRAPMAWMAAAFAAGALCCGLAFQLLPGQASSHQLMPWVQAVAAYQSLYTHDTVAYLKYDPVAAAETVSRIQREDGIALRVPDLSSAGLSFKRVQRLSFNGKPLIQLVYQPEHGDPVALCVITDPKPDEMVAMQHDKSMDVVTWRQDKLGYALVGNPQSVDLAALGERIAKNELGSLLDETAATKHS